jgi:triacylglycerol esterase/lipase EstA (alpha/beta hydrolase family)
MSFAPQAVNTLTRSVALHLGEVASIATLLALRRAQAIGRGLEAPRRSDHARCPANARPVILIHGCGADASCWIPLRASLRRAGYRHIEVMRYNPVGASVPVLAERLARRCEAARHGGASKVHLIGHSLGGIILRYAMTELGLDACTSAAITIASPHRGTPVASIGTIAQRFGIRHAAVDVAPAAPLLARLDGHTTTSAVRWTSYY